MDDTFADANAGIWTWTLGGGEWSYEVKLDGDLPPGYAGNYCEGYYDVHGDRVDFTTVTVYPSGDCASKTWLARWRQTDQGLQMDVIADWVGYDFLFGSKEWQRVV